MGEANFVRASSGLKWWAGALWGVGVLVNVAAALFAATRLRPFYYDGSFFLHQFFLKQGVFSDPPYIRWVDVLWQIPSLLALLFSRWGDMTEWAVSRFCFWYSVHPFLSLAGCFWILKKKSRLDLMIFPLLCYSAAVLPMMPFVVNMAVDSIDLFWPMFFLVFFRSPGATGELAIIFLLAIGMALSYEPALILFGLLAVVSFRRCWQTDIKAKRERRTDFLLSLVFGLGAVWLAYRIFGPTAGTNKWFRASLNHPLGVFRLYCFSLTVAVIAPLVFSKRGWPFDLAIGLGLCATAWFWDVGFVRFVPGFQMDAGYDARTTALPLCFLIALVSYSRMRIVPSSEPTRNWIVSGIFLFSLQVMSAAYDVKITQLWSDGIGVLQQVMKTKPGCSFIDQPAADVLQSYGVTGQSSPLISLLMQQKKRVTSLVFTATGPHRQPCIEIDGKSYVRRGQWPAVGNYFDFTDVSQP